MARQRDRGRLEGPFPNRTALCRPERALRSVLYQIGGPSIGLGGPSVGRGRSEGPSVGLRALYMSGRILCRLKGPSVGLRGPSSLSSDNFEGPLSDVRTLCRAERALSPSSANLEGPLSAVRALCQARGSSVGLRGPSSLSSANC